MERIEDKVERMANSSRTNRLWKAKGVDYAICTTAILLRNTYDVITMNIIIGGKFESVLTSTDQSISNKDKKCAYTIIH